jgi:hypothetical protein
LRLIKALAPYIAVASALLVAIVVIAAHKGKTKPESHATSIPRAAAKKKPVGLSRTSTHPNKPKPKPKQPKRRRKVKFNHTPTTKRRPAHPPTTRVLPSAPDVVTVTVTTTAPSPPVNPRKPPKPVALKPKPKPRPQPLPKPKPEPPFVWVLVGIQAGGVDQRGIVTRLREYDGKRVVKLARAGSFKLTKYHYKQLGDQLCEVVRPGTHNLSAVCQEIKKKRQVIVFSNIQGQ